MPRSSQRWWMVGGVGLRPLVSNQHHCHRTKGTVKHCRKSPCLPRRFIRFRTNVLSLNRDVLSTDKCQWMFIIPFRAKPFYTYCFLTDQRLIVPYSRTQTFNRGFLLNFTVISMIPYWYHHEKVGNVDDVDVNDYFFHITSFTGTSKKMPTLRAHLTELWPITKMLWSGQCAVLLLL